mgnify:CR=1 FL=1
MPRRRPLSLSLKPSLNWLFAFIPIAAILDRVGGVAPPLVFFSAAIAIIPVAGLIVRSTEQVAKRTGDAIGGLLNATFGNAPELIIAIVALKAGLGDMVRASLVGAILANLLLSLGLAFVLGGVRQHVQKFNVESARLRHNDAHRRDQHGRAERLQPILRADEPNPRGAAAQSWDRGGAADRLRTLLGIRAEDPPGDLRERRIGGAHEHEGAAWSMPRAAGSLLAASVLAAWMSEILVGSAEATGKALGMSEIFIGIVILPLVGGAAEGGSAIAMARKTSST